MAYLYNIYTILYLYSAFIFFVLSYYFFYFFFSPSPPSFVVNYKINPVNGADRRRRRRHRSRLRRGDDYFCNCYYYLYFLPTIPFRAQILLSFAADEQYACVLYERQSVFVWFSRDGKTRNNNWPVPATLGGSVFRILASNRNS